MENVEKFYRNENGEIVFLASGDIGANGTFECSHLHGYRDNGFPKSMPAARPQRSIWDQFKGLAKHTQDN